MIRYRFLQVDLFRTPKSSTPMQIQRNSTIIPSKDRNLLRPRRHPISSEVRTALKHQLSTLRPERALLNARSTSESAVQDTTIALGRAQSEGIALGTLYSRSVTVDSRGGVSSASPRDIPLSIRDQAALAGARDLDIQASLSAEGSAGGSRGRPAGRVSCRRGSRGRGAGAFGQVLDARGGTFRLGERDGGFEGAGLERAADVEEVPDFVEGAARAAEVDFLTVLFAEGGLDFGRRVSLCCRRRDSGVREEVVGGEGLEQGDGAVEEDGDFLGGLVVGVAGRVEGGDAGAVLAPLVLPEGLVVALVILPVLLHDFKSFIGAGGLQDVGDVGVGAARVAVGFVGAVTVVGPQAVQSPGVVWAGWGVCVPELCLEEGAAGGVEAAEVFLGGGVVAGEFGGGAGEGVEGHDGVHVCKDGLGGSEGGEGVF
jgi:hypothetical protein